MITGAIGIFLVVIGIILSSNGDLGSAAVAWVLAALVIFGGMVARDDARAEVNWLNYWSSSGKERARMRRRWNGEARAEEEKRRAKQETKLTQSEFHELVQRHNLKRDEEHRRNGTMRCEKCGQTAFPGNRSELPDGRVITLYQCPYCGTSVWK